MISNNGWFHVLWHWRSSTGKLLLYKNGNRFQEKTDILKLGTLPEIMNGHALIGDSNFHGDITAINLWSSDLSLNMIVTLAQNPGNVAGNIFSWKFVEDNGFGVSAPSKCHNRQGRQVILATLSLLKSQLNLYQYTSYVRKLYENLRHSWNCRVIPQISFSLEYKTPRQGNTNHFQYTE